MKTPRHARRGRLTEVERLPPACDAAFNAALAAITARQQTQGEIREALNAAIAAQGSTTRISRSAFNRFATKVLEGEVVPRGHVCCPRCGHPLMGGAR